MATGRYTRRTAGPFTVNRQPSSVASNHGSAMYVCRHDMLSKIIPQGTVDGSSRRRKLRKSWKDNTVEWTGLSMSSLLRIADDRVSELVSCCLTALQQQKVIDVRMRYDRGRWAVIAGDASVGVPQQRLGVMGIS